jgi:hypothetical protein
LDDQQQKDFGMKGWTRSLAYQLKPGSPAIQGDKYSFVAPKVCFQLRGAGLLCLHFSGNLLFGFSLTLEVVFPGGT